MAERGTRDQWIIQGHIGSTWQDGQYVRTRDMEKVRPAFEDLLARLETDHVELGMIHYVDDVDEFRGIMEGPFIEYVRHLHAAGTIEHVGLSTHNPDVAALAASCGEVEMIMFSVNPAFDTLSCQQRHRGAVRRLRQRLRRHESRACGSCTRCASARTWASR